MGKLTIVIPGPIVPYPRHRTRVIIMPGKDGKPRGLPQNYLPAKARAYLDDLAFRARVALGTHWTADKDSAYTVSMTAEFGVPKSWPKARRAGALDGTVRHTSKPDADNILKLMDGLTGVVWRDDAQVVEATVTKAYGPVEQLTITVER